MTIRYSPLPINAYGKQLTVKGAGRTTTVIDLGPGASPLLANDPEAWNLAFLSHPFETHETPEVSGFAVLVRRTLQVRVATGELDIVELEPERSVRPLLRLPPLQAVLRLMALPTPVIRALPLWIAYGEVWENRIRRRASFLTSAQDPEEDVADVSEAAGYLRRFGRDSS